MSDLNKVVTFKLGRGRFAFPILDVQEVIPASEVTRMPETPDFLLGVIDLRGTVIPVLDLSVRMGEEGKRALSERKNIVVRTGKHLTGCLVDDVEKVMVIAPDSIASPDELRSRAARFVKGVARTENGLVMILDTVRILSDEELEELDGVESRRGEKTNQC